MSSKDGRIIIPRQESESSPLPTCNPNLMPFHIKYTGPAAVSMFFHVEKMKVEQEKDEEKVKELNDKKGSEPNPIKAQTQEPASSTPPLVSPQKKPSKSEKDADTRFISSFRGRTIHGLSMDIPTGYTGLLLHGDPQPTTVSHVDRVLHHPNDSVDDNDLEMDEQEIPPLRKLIPQSTFSSITLWHADRAVDETRDEYYRTLTEWMALSHEIHRTDL